MKPFSQASENNKGPILEVLKVHFSNASHVLEIGTGTGQHAIFFAGQLPHIFWQTSDRDQNHQGINSWLDSTPLHNVGKPISLNVMQREQWPDHSPESAQSIHQIHDFDGVFSANTAHIMPWAAVCEMFAGVGRILSENGRFILYGPFNRDGYFTSPSNEKFHQMLIEQNSDMGIRDDQDVLELGSKNCLNFVDDVQMPANNRILVFSKSTPLSS